MIQNKRTNIGVLIARYCDGSLTPEERSELDAWRQLSPANEQLFSGMISPEGRQRYITDFVKDGAHNDRLWEQISKRTFSRRKKMLRAAIAYSSVAAALAVAVAISWPRNSRDNVAQGPVISMHDGLPVLIFPDGSQMEITNNTETEVTECSHLALMKSETRIETATEEKTEDEYLMYHTLKIPRGSGHRLMFADSTVIYLNADTEITFPAQFAHNERKVFLRKGEAIFEVSRDPQRPFTVDAGPVTIKVLGTTFGIRAYDEEGSIRAILESGSVRMIAGNVQTELEPETQGVFDREKGGITVEQADINSLFAWREGKIVFDNTPLRSILDNLERIYAFSAEYADSLVGSIPFSLSLRRGEEFGKILELIEATGKVSFDADGSLIRVSKAPDQ